MDKDYHNWSDDQLKEMIADHDCHRSPEDGCDCLLWKDELDKRAEINNREGKIL